MCQNKRYKYVKLDAICRAIAFFPLRPTFFIQIVLKTTHFRKSHPVDRYGPCTTPEQNYEASVCIADNNTIRSANTFGRVPYR